MLVLLALIPAIALLIFIYVKDKKEKEPIGLLIKCFVFGILIVIPILIMESALEKIYLLFFTSGSLIGAFIDAFFMAALSEELFKNLALKKLTWKNRAFNCSFDGIVYAVFVSLGFAAFENVLYVVSDGIGAALFRMFTAVPCHAFVAVFMGYYYSKAKKAFFDNDKALEKKYKSYSLLVPMICHGLYDWPLLIKAEIAGDAIAVLGFFAWVIFIIVQTVVAFRLVNKASKMDTLLFTPSEIMDSAAIYMNSVPNAAMPATENPNQVIPSTPYAAVPNADNIPPVTVPTSSSTYYGTAPGIWTCTCQSVNDGNFCPVCGSKRP